MLKEILNLLNKEKLPKFEGKVVFLGADFNTDGIDPQSGSCYCVDIADLKNGGGRNMFSIDVTPPEYSLGKYMKPGEKFELKVIKLSGGGIKVESVGCKNSSIHTISKRQKRGEIGSDGGVIRVSVPFNIEPDEIVKINGVNVLDLSMLISSEKDQETGEKVNKIVFFCNS